MIRARKPAVLSLSWIPWPLVYALLGLYIGLWGFSQLQEACQPDPPHLNAHPLVSELDLVLQIQRNSTTNCADYGTLTDVYFFRYGGVQCHNFVWQSAASTELPGKYVSKLDVTYKEFESEEKAKEFYKQFWALHVHTPISTQYLMDITANATVGEGRRMYSWDPVSMTSMQPIFIEFRSKQFMSLFRHERTLVKVWSTGFDGSPALEYSIAAFNNLLQAILSQLQHHAVRPSPACHAIRTVAALSDGPSQWLHARLGPDFHHALLAMGSTLSRSDYLFYSILSGALMAALYVFSS